MTRKLEVSPAEKLNRDRWRTAAVALDQLLQLSDPDFGGVRVTPETLSDEDETKFRTWLAPVLTKIGIEPLQAALRADARNADLLLPYAGEDTVMAYTYMDMRDAAPKPSDSEGLGKCEYFALCANPADGVVRHPILGEVPACQRCAAKTGQELLKPAWAA